MARPASYPRPSAPHAAPPSPYLVLYNSLSALLWLAVLCRTLALTAQHGPRAVFAGTWGLAQWTQTLAGLEVVHAGAGMVRSPLATTALQVASRFVVVWAVGARFPAATAASPACAAVLLAWAVAEVLRYSYLACRAAARPPPRALLWLRYSAFFLLYPVGIASECVLVWRALEPARARGPAWRWALTAVLCLYPPGAWVLFRHMMRQRRKVLAAGERENRQ